ncbi:MAG: serine/threonine protein kinase [Pseudohongiellaceae bacterium]|jgi:serine/threonine protein kinase
MDHEADIKRLFDEVVELSPSERRRFLDEHCSPGPLRDELEQLLSHHDASTGFLPPGSFVLGHEDVPEATAGPPRTRPVLSGSFGRYEIRGILGRGGMAVVYLAHDPKLDRLVALKTLHGDSNDPARLARFQVEAKVLARLTHPNIVPVYEAGDVHGQDYLAMQYIEGDTLERQLAAERTRVAQVTGPHQRPDLTAHQRDMALLIARLSDGLEHAHVSGIVHRDVKPSNIIIDQLGQPHLTDFGIAKMLGAAAVTRDGDITGSCRYLSPEQARADNEHIDARSDVFSLGVVLYESLSLTVPFHGDTVAEVLMAVASSEPKHLRLLEPRIPKELATICHKALEKKRENRYQTAAAMAADLRTFLAGRPILARPPSLLRKGSDTLHRHRLASVSVGLVVVVLTLATILWRDAQRKRSLRFEVTITSRSGEAQIYLSRFDPELGLYGPPTDEGNTPSSLSLLPGLYAITGVDEKQKFAETTVFSIRAKVQVDVDLLLLAPDAALEGMIPIPAGARQLGNPLSDSGRSRPRTVALPKYYIAQAEVSNAEYAEFVAATTATAPSGWTQPYDHAIDNLPVVGITRTEAEAYARWRGLRLPSEDEHEAAARYLDGGSPAQWATGPRPQGLPRFPRPTPHTRRGLWAAYLEQVAEVRSHPEAATSTGLYHLNTNVSEWVSDIDFEVIPAPVHRGGNWTRDSEDWDLSSYATNPPESWSITVGFRCARSADHTIEGRE